MNRNNKNRFSIIWGGCLFVLFYIIIVGFGRGTYAYFGDPSGTGNLGGNIYSVFYYRNWPNIDDTEVFQDKKYNITKLLSYDEIFTSLDGYKFIGWNTSRDGSGSYYDVEQVFNLTADFNLYAQWKLIIAYGDLNEDGIVNNDDYSLIDNYLNQSGNITDGGRINADVNQDGVIDLIDLDIIKQVNLGTVGYVGFLPNKPILIYDIYEGNIDIGDDDKPVGEDNKDNIDNNGNENISNGGSGNGQTGNGNESSGNGTGGKPNSGNNISSGDENNNLDENVDNEGNVSDNDESDNRNENKLKFKFMNGNLEYSYSECVIEDGKCLLNLPKDNPKIDGYKFTGWNEDKECSSGRGILKSVYVDSDKIYYACFVENRNYKDIYLLIIILCICLVSFKLIWNLIRNFRKDNNNIDSSQ